MTQYVAIPRAWSSDTHTVEDRPTCTVWEESAGNVNTGLLDQHGTPLWRVVTRAPIGFVVTAGKA